MNANNTATARQRFALWCITKKDYRNEILSKEEAARLISDLGDKDYKSKKVNKHVKAELKSNKKTVKDELFDYIKQNADDLWKVVSDELGYKSVVTLEANGKEHHYAMVGFGCGITYLEYRKNNKRAAAIDQAAGQLRNNEVRKMMIERLPKGEYAKLREIGSPFEAVWGQMMNIQSAYYHMVADFARTKGIKMKVVSRLD